jgi:hypothetical protein
VKTIARWRARSLATAVPENKKINKINVLLLFMANGRKNGASPGVAHRRHRPAGRSEAAELRKVLMSQ